MKTIIFLFIAALTILSCSSPAKKTAGTDTIIAGDSLAKIASTSKNSATITSLCFLRTEGKQHLDSTTIELSIKGNTVTGEMIWTPYQKDSRKGILNGTQTGDTINAVWTFKQEGITDTMLVKYKLATNKLLQKPLKLNTKTGRQQTDESADYTVEYHPVGSIRP
ncbi:MAG: hypothetical protein V4592_02900 [Bacteroidota bacterium]